METILLLLASIVGIFCICLLYRRWLNAALPDNHTKHSDIASALQNIVIVISIVGGGAWTIYTFNALQMKEKAEDEYQKLKASINNTEASNISISTKVVDYNGLSDDKKSKGLIIEVKISNKGSNAIELDFKESPLTVYKVQAQGTKMGYEKKLRPELISSLAPLNQEVLEANDAIENRLIKKWVSLIQSERVLSYFVTVDIDSMYYITFKSNAKDITYNSDKNTEQKIEVCADCKWFASKYIFIPADSPPKN